ncbi:MAG: LysR family transcriptional regulator [Paracoccaceae bacterium]|nr:MAG: LysR family transcriptional regulator [Paracoccaceae bacterium]
MPAPGLSDADLRHLRTFAGVAAAGGFAQATVTLGLSLSTISGQVKALEDRLGLTLCARGRAGFRLTEAGRTVLAEARTLIAASDGFAARVAGLRDRLAGPVRIGMLDATLTDPAARLTEAVAAFAAAAPEAELTLVARPPDELLRAVSEATLDAAVGSFPRVALGLDYADLYRERQQFHAGAGHPLFATPDAEIDFEAVRRHRIVARSYWGARDVKAFAGTRVGAVVDGMEAEAVLILSGGFLGYLPVHYAAPHVAAGRMRAIAPARFAYTAPFQLAWRPDRAALPRVAALLRAILLAHGRAVPPSLAAGGRATAAGNPRSAAAARPARPPQSPPA